MIAWLMALVLILTSSMYIVYAEEESSSGEEISREKEEKEEKEEKKEEEEKSSDEGSSEDQGENNSSDDQEQPVDTGDGGQEQPGVDDQQPESGADDGQSAEDQSSQDTQEDLPMADEGAADPVVEDMQEEVPAEDVSSVESEVVESELPVIIKYIETDEYPEGTILREYQDVDEYGNPVLIREIATAPVVDVIEEEEMDLLDHFGLVASNTELPNFDNGGWPGIPASYEYNWDNTQNATQSGMWGGNGHLQGYVAATIEDINVRHRMQMYCDGDNIHLLITYASCFDNPGNGNDYCFYLDGEQVRFKVVYDDNGKDLTYERAPGTYTLKILHEDGRGSSYEALGASGTMTVHEGQLNNVTEISIPVSEMARQNKNINADSFSLVEFFTHNLMYRRIATAGASSGPLPFALMSVVFFSGAYCVSERKKYVRDPKSL